MTDWEDTDYESKAHWQEGEYRAEPGDVLLYSDGSRTLVRYARLKTEWRSRGCGCGCTDEHHEYQVWVDGDEPIEVITKGGGTAHIMPAARYYGEWPPTDALVLRDGVPLFGKEQEGGSDTEKVA